ncbi:nitroreductase family protein [Vibrio sp. S4M6]|uniref:nitroreductase family protein n=1 Tax=Vibrio sinus TaxID=2946865 RepID=UPI00202A1DD1|nr:nitroreductase family protein [Vibrio sinus]MCL9780773.1 nitroreductase family protein [Vibrio sinus]
MSKIVDTYSSSGLSDYHKTWPEFNFPQRPILVPNLVNIRNGEQEFLFRGREVRTLHGESMNWIKTHLFPLLDGEHTADQILQKLPELEESSLIDLLLFLNQQGLIEDQSKSVPLSSDEPLSHLAQISALLPIIQRFTHRTEAANHLQQLSVALVGHKTQCHLVIELLTAHNINTSWLGETLPEDLKMDHANIVVCISSSSNQQSDENRFLVKHKQPVCFANPTLLTVGPLVIPSQSGCLNCLNLQRSSPIPPDEKTRSVLMPAWAGLLVQQLMAWHTNLFSCQVINQQRSCLPDTESIRFLRLSHCHDCNPTRSTLPANLQVVRQKADSGTSTAQKDKETWHNLPLIYLRTVSLQQWQTHNPGAMKWHISPEVKQITATSYLSINTDNSSLNSGYTTLPKPNPVWQETNAELLLGEPVSNVQMAASISDLLYLSLGEVHRHNPNTNKSNAFRLTASGGNLGSSEGYLLTTNRHQTEVNVYQKQNHSLKKLGLISPSNRTDIAGQLGIEPKSRNLGEDSASDSLLVVCGSLSRVRQKYGERSYQLCHLDAGLIAHRIVQLAPAMGLKAHIHTQFDDDAVTTLLHVNEEEQLPILIIEFAQSN